VGTDSLVLIRSGREALSSLASHLSNGNAVLAESLRSQESGVFLQAEASPTCERHEAAWILLDLTSD
jgi:hypothetical protein